ncbi:MAG: autotransporter-associated beta strand repeat-containing protein, partial [Verrucomicrobiota bacterium]
MSAIGVTGAGPLTLGAGGIDMSVATVNLTLGPPIALGVNQTWNVTSGMTLAASGIISGTGISLAKAGAGTLTLSGSAVNTFTGGLAVNGGTLLENFSNLSTPTNLINTGNVLTLAGGALSLTGKASAVTSQSFASTTLNSGGSVVTLTQNGATSLTAALGGITRNAGSTLNFSVVPSPSGVIATTSNTNETSGILGPWASVGTTTSLQYGTVNSSKVISYTGATTTLQAANLSDVTSASVNYAFGATVTPTLTGNISGNTLRFTGGTAGTLANGGFTTTLNGLMNAGSASLTVSGAGNLVIGANKELVIIANGQGTTISSSSAPFTKIVDNGAGASSLVYSGAGSTLTLNCATNAYSGGTVINSGSVSTAATGNTTDTYFGTGLVTINPGATLSLNRTYLANNLTLNNATVTSGNSFSSTLAAGSTITLKGITTFNISGGLSIASNMTGSGGLIKTSSTVALPVIGTNNYTGPTTINQGGLTFMPQALYGGTPANWTPANITVASAAALGLYFSDSGTLNGYADFSSAQVNTLVGNLTTAIYNNGLKAGSLIAFDESHGNGTYSGTIADSTGVGGGSIGVNKLGGNTLTLSGNNTFSGPVTIGPNGTSGGTLRVYSLNSVNSGTPPLANSSLGRPTTVTNGTITCGNSSSNGGVGLHYLGTGETTDRVLALNAGVSGGATALTLD